MRDMIFIFFIFEMIDLLEIEVSDMNEVGIGIGFEVW